MQERSKHPLVVGCLLLGLAAIPDAMIVPVLHDLTVDRFGVSESAAHLLMAVNLLGAILAVGLLFVFKRRFPSSVLLLASAILSAIFMAGMALSTTWWAMLAFRCLEGGADLVLLSVPFRLIASAGRKERYGGRMGGGFTVMMVALALGVGLGGFIGRESPVAVLWVGVSIMALLTPIILIVRRTVDNVPTSPVPEPHSCPLIPKEWLGAGFLAIDRGLAALVSTSLPLLLASGFNIGKMTLGLALAGMFLALASFSAPVGVLADRHGGGKIRLISALLCGFAVAGLGLMAWLPPIIVLPPCLLIYGAGAAGLMPSAFSIAVRPEASNLVFGSLQTAGQAGYAIGVLTGAWIVSIVALPAESLLSTMFPVAGVSFIIVNIVLLGVLRKMPDSVR
ncbi:MAG: MFS transporter [Planctomycetes bacterium]|nr:MFS transporter [Planctomycetota bacterium]